MQLQLQYLAVEESCVLLLYSFVGPSSLYQRWNLHVRHSYGLLQEKKEVLPLNSSSNNNKMMMMMMKVLVIERKEFRNLWFV